MGTRRCGRVRCHRNSRKSGFGATKRFSIGHMKNRMLVFACGLACLNVVLTPETMGSNRVAEAFVCAPDGCFGRTAGFGVLRYRGTHSIQACQANEQQSATLGQFSSLVVNITDAKHDDGSAGVALWDGPEGFPEEIEHAIRIAYVPISAGVASASFVDLAPGNYAVTVYNDKNGNETFDKNWLGIPRESWGVSNDARPRLRAPAYEEAVFEIGTAERSLEIGIR